MSVILTSLSLIPSKKGTADAIELAEYTCYYDSHTGTNQIVSGGYTSMAPLEYLIKKANERFPEDEIKVICITTPEVYSKKLTFKNCKVDDGDYSTYEYYQHLICSEYSKFCKKISVDFIPYKFRINENGVEPISDGIEATKYLFECLIGKNVDGEKIFIDFTGAQRDTAYLITTIIRYLTTENAEVIKIIYSNFDRDNDANNRIYQVKYIYKLDELTEAINDFIHTGNVDRMKQFFDKEYCSDEIKEMILSLDDFVKTISIGQVDKLDSIRDSLNEKIKRLDETKGSAKNIYSLIFYSLVPKIKESLHIGEDGKFGYTEMIRWCIDHRYIQQAINIYVEKIPCIYWERGINPDNLGLKEKESKGAGRESAFFYEVFFGSIYNKIAPHHIFAQKLSQINVDEFINRNVNRYLSSSKITFSDEEKKAIRELKKYIANYVKNPKRKIYGSVEEQKDKEKRLNRLLYNSGENTAHWLLYGTEASKEETFLKKCQAIKYISDKLGNEHQLVSAMKYFLLIKQIRNSIDHVDDFDETKNVTELFESLFNGNPVSSFDYDTVKGILETALDECNKITEDFKKKDLLI